MTLIHAGTVVAEGAVFEPGWVRTEGPLIVSCGTGDPPAPPDVRLPDSTVVPGFVDMHVHGGGGASFSDPGGAHQATDFHRRHGTTTMLASLVTAAPGELARAVAELARAARAGVIAGIHLEGPWLSEARCGAHDRTRLRPPDPAEVDALLDAADGAISMVTLAPELPGADTAISRFVDAGVVVAVGHTDATYEQTRHAIELGATVGTHLFNAMPPLSHRAPGPVLALLGDPRVTVELIADGVHVHPEMVRAVAGAVGPERVAVITDATAASGCGDGEFRLGSVPVTVTAGVARVRGTDTIAGSTATMDQLFTAMAHGCGLNAAVRATSTTPARALGLHGVGAIRAGLAADLVVLDRDLRVAAVMSGGRWPERR
ncbi:N-acetylglucosamine-6-phosphate deacetylase [Mycobacterium sp.]|uniref:N-acetylglucosamine-6-phosphate deacetylase n=1 Tax=Mycobacterium sp. TaxID=1785 RepID=UPI003A83CC6D